MIRVIGLGDQVVDKYEHLRIMYPGGNALNFAVFAAKLGIPAAFLGAFGSDAEGRHVLDTVKKLELDISHSRVYDGENGCARVELQNGDRVFLGSNRCGVLRTIGLGLTEEDLTYLCGFDLIHSSLYGFSELYLDELHRRGTRISYDFSSDFTKKDLDRVLPCIDYAFFSCSHLSLAKMRRLLAEAHRRGCELALATRGSEGAYLFDGQQEYRQPPVMVDATDTMAAGDAFITCFITAYLRQISRSVHRAHPEDPAGESAALHSRSIREALQQAAEFSSRQCLTDGSFGYGITY